MTGFAIGPGCIIHWVKYKFSDGETRNKYLVIAGAKTGSNYLAVIGTSVPKGKDFKPGCQGSYYHIPGGKKDWFAEDTWLLVAEPREIAPTEFLKLGMAKVITLEGQLREDIANALRNCIKACSDVSDLHKELL